MKSVLRLAKGERDLIRWIKKHPVILTHTIQFGKFVAAEFPFGTDFRADFVVLGPFSGGWDIHFVELEPPNSPLFTQAGKQARRLVDAVAQIDAWRTFIEKERPTVIRDLSKFVQKRELVYGDRGHESVDHCGWNLYHPKSQLNWHYKIVIGRLQSITDDTIQKKASFKSHHDIEVMTYDRLLRAAQELDDN